MPTRPHPVSAAILAGLAGSVAMTAVHETARRLIPQAPRLDSLGRRALARVLRAAGQSLPDRDTLQAVALAGDVVTNTGLFAGALVTGAPGSAPGRGAVVGTLAGLATLALPPVLQIGPAPHRLASATRIMTVGLYAWGGWMAGRDYRRRFEAGGRGS